MNSQQSAISPLGSREYTFSVGDYVQGQIQGNKGMVSSPPTDRDVLLELGVPASRLRNVVALLRRQQKKTTRAQVAKCFSSRPGGARKYNVTFVSAVAGLSTVKGKMEDPVPAEDTKQVYLTVSGGEGIFAGIDASRLIDAVTFTVRGCSHHRRAPPFWISTPSSAKGRSSAVCLERREIVELTSPSYSLPLPSLSPWSSLLALSLLALSHLLYSSSTSSSIPSVYAEIEFGPSMKLVGLDHTIVIPETFDSQGKSVRFPLPLTQKQIRRIRTVLGRVPKVAKLARQSMSTSKVVVGGAVAGGSVDASVVARSRTAGRRKGKRRRKRSVTEKY